jgi:hypothetical protein
MRITSAKLDDPGQETLAERNRPAGDGTDVDSGTRIENHGTEPAKPDDDADVDSSRSNLPTHPQTFDFPVVPQPADTTPRHLAVPATDAGFPSTPHQLSPVESPPLSPLTPLLETPYPQDLTDKTPTEVLCVVYPF